MDLGEPRDGEGAQASHAWLASLLAEPKPGSTPLLLYYITDRTQFPGDESARHQALLRKIEEAAICGIDYIQLREKDLSGRDLESLAHAAVQIIQQKSHGKTLLLINSRTDIAVACGADGVHLRSHDISPDDVRKIWTCGAGALARESPAPVIAVSCHTTEDVARAAISGADFAVFAPVFEKKNSPNAHPTGLPALRDACRHKIPVLALGGVTVENAQSCIDAGAAGIAGIRLFQENDGCPTLTERFLRG